MLNPKVLIKLLNSRSSVAWKGLQNGLHEGVFGAGEDQWVGKSREHQSHSPRLDKPSSSGLGSLFCKWIRVHHAD